MTTLLCPRCTTPLLDPEKGASAHVCSSCGGLWIERQLAACLDTLEVAQMLMRLADDAARRAPFGGSVGQKAIPCPQCRRLMSRRQHSRVQVVVDLCAEHGIWFDRGELQQVAALAATRGAGPFRTAPRLAEPAPAGPPRVASPPPPPPTPAPDAARTFDSIIDAAFDTSDIDR